MMVSLELLKNKWVQLALVAVVGLGLGFAVGYSNRKEPQIRIEEKIVEKTIVDEKAIEIAVENAKKEWSKNQKERVVTRVVTKPSGEKIEETVRETETTETGKEEQEKLKETTVVKTETVEKERQTRHETNPYRPQWSLGVQVHKEVSSMLKTTLLENLDYSIHGGRQVVSDLWLDMSYKIKSKDLGLGFSYKF